ncbi:hypothetical protein GOEFS_027_00120, partial [Gordonia effusa NBRC 100432]
MTDNRINRRLEAFPIGYHHFHSDVSVNFQLNRFFGWVGDPDMLNEMRSAAEISDYPGLVHTFLELGEKCLADDRVLSGAAYFRIAEFFLPASDERKQSTRRRFVGLVKEYYDVDEQAHSLIAYDSGMLSAYRFTPSDPLGTIIVFGGFDSYIEEWFRAAFVLEAAGYDVVLFEGPGQGTPLEDYGITFTPDWHVPVGAVLDYYGIDDATLVGFSMG